MAIDSIKANPQLQNDLQLTMKDIEGAAMFKKKLLASFLNAR